jgi:hypothetical protein
MVQINARQQLDDLLHDESIKTLAVVRGDAASGLAGDVDIRTQGLAWRRTVWVPATGIITAAEEQKWFGTDPQAGAVVLGSVSKNRQVVGSLRPGVSLRQIEKLLLKADGA